MTHAITRLSVVLSLLAILALAVNAPARAETTPRALPEKPDTAARDTSAPVQDTIIVYYFHGTQRCATCRKLEAYSAEALAIGFEDMLEDSTLIWKPVDYDIKENEHFIKDYKLFTKALILSRVRAGTEIAWTNLDKIWQLVGDKEKYVSYVIAETNAFFSRDDTDE